MNRHCRNLAHPRLCRCGLSPQWPQHEVNPPAPPAGGCQPPHPVMSEVTSALAKHEAAAPYPTGGQWVAVAGACDVEPGISGTDIRWSANPVLHLNPLMARNRIKPVEEGLF